MDDHGQKMQDLESALGLASAFEKYNQAADLKKELVELNANDVVEQILEVTIFRHHSQTASASAHKAADLSVSPCVHSKSEGTCFSASRSVHIREMLLHSQLHVSPYKYCSSCQFCKTLLSSKFLSSKAF